MSNAKNVGKGLGGGALAIIAILVLIVLGAGIYVFTAHVGGAADKAANKGREKSILFDPNNSIGQYEEFYDKCRAVVTFDQQIIVGEDEVQAREKGYNPETDPFGNEQKSISALHENVRALKNQQIRAAQEYNADSSKATQSVFKAVDLPPTIDAPYSEISCGDPKVAERNRGY